MSDFNDEILKETAHRPWPMPSAPWIMTQTWHDLLFAHWAVDVEAVCAHSVVYGARWVFGLPYYTAAMDVREHDGQIHYTSRRTSRSSHRAELVVRYRPTGPVYEARPGTQGYFLTERYCLYTVDKKSRPHRLEIHHPPWPLQRAEATFEVLEMTGQMGMMLPDQRPLLHFAKRQDVVAFPMTRA